MPPIRGVEFQFLRGVCNIFYLVLRDSVPSARRDWLPPDPLQAELSHDVDVVMDLSVYRSFDKLTHFLHPLI